MIKALSFNHWYLKAFLYVSIFLFTIMVLFSLVFTKLLTDNAVREIDSFNIQRVNQIKQNADYTLQRLKMFTGSMALDQSINAWMIQTQDELWTYQTMDMSVNRYLSAEPLIHSVYLTNPAINRTYSSETGAGRWSDFRDADLLRTLRARDARNMHFINIYMDGISYLALPYSHLPEMPDNAGQLILLLDKQRLDQYLLQLETDQQSDVLVVNGDGEVILGRNDEGYEQVKHFRPTANAGQERMVIKGKTWLIRYDHMHTEDWIIYRMTPLDALYNNIDKMRWWTLFGFALLYCILSLTWFYYSRRNLKPFAGLVQTFLNKLGKSPQVANAEDAARFIRQNVESLVLQVENLDRTVKDSRQLKKEEMLRQWILHGDFLPGLMDERSGGIPLLAAERLRLAVFRIENYGAFSKKYPFPSDRLLKYAIGNIACEIGGQSGLVCESADFGSDHVAFLMSDPPGMSNASYDAIMRDIKQNIDKWLNISLVLALSEPLDAWEDLLHTYEAMLEATMLKFIVEEDKIYSEHDLKHYQETLQPDLNEELIDELVKSARLGNSEAARWYLDQWADKMPASSYAECKLRLSHLIYLLMKSFKRLESVKGLEGIHRLVDEFENRRAAMDWIEAFLQEVMKDLQQRSRTNRKEEIAADALQFIMNNLTNPMLNAEMIAEHTSVSVSYLRQTFKEWTDMTLADFVMKQRIERVKDILKTTDLSAKVIAEQSGFQTKSHFFTAFKKETGMTPIQFREHESRN